MKEWIEHWKEIVGVVLYFGLLAWLTPYAKSRGWGYEGELLIVVGGGIFVVLLYLLVRFGVEEIEKHRDEMSDFREFMGIGRHPVYALHPSDLGTVEDYRNTDEIDALIAGNPYASTELLDDRNTHLLAAVALDNDDEIDTPVPVQSGHTLAIIGENPRRRLDMAPNFQPDANDLAATGVAAFGIPGSGKTTVLMRLAEQYIKHFYLPCVIFDSQGDGLSLTDISPNGHIAVPGRVPSMQAVITYGLQVIFDLTEWHKPGEVGMNPEMAAQMITKAIRALMVAQKAIEPAKRRTCLVGLDEIHIWTPQSRTPGGMTPQTANDLYNAVMQLATTGRKLGLMPMFAAQRIATVHNDVIGSVETRLFGKTDLDNDLRRYREYVKPDIATDQQIRSFKPGEMIVCHAGQRLHTQFYNRETYHASHTPSVTTDLEKFRQKLPPELLSMLTQQHQRQGAIPEPVLADHPMEMHAVQTERRASGQLSTATHAPTEGKRSVGRVDLQKNAKLRTALALYQEGYTSSRTLGEKMEVDKNTANGYINQLKRMGEIV